MENSKYQEWDSRTRTVTLCYGVLSNEIPYGEAETEAEAIETAKQYYLKAQTDNSNEWFCHVDRPEDDELSVQDITVLVRILEEIMTHAGKVCSQEYVGTTDAALLQQAEELRSTCLSWLSDKNSNEYLKQLIQRNRERKENA